MSDVVIAYSLEPPRYIAQYLLRELRVHWSQVSREELDVLLAASSVNGIRRILIVHDAELYLDAVQWAPPSSIILIALFDESYSESMFDICAQASVFSIYRFFGVTRIRMNILGYLTRYLADTGLSIFAVRKFVEEVRLHRELVPRLKRWEELAAKVTILPSPYSDGFAALVSAEWGVPDDKSLAMVAERLVDVSEVPSLSLSFMGALHHAQRHAAIRATRNVRDSSVVIRQGWSGESSEIQVAEYVRLLRSSAFTLAPPGYICNESFRSTEAMICGSIPVSLPATLSQSVRSQAFDTPGLVGSSWRYLRRRMLSLSHEERLGVLEDALRSYLEETETLQERIYADVVSGSAA